ncbi:MAG: glycerol kinase GlpK, partial [Actinomycetota bacterium]
MNILAIDSGTTGVTALVVSSTGEVLSRGYCEFEQHFPKPGWVEHDPEQIWQAVLISTKAAVANFSI